MMTIVVKVFAAFGLTVSEDKTDTLLTLNGGETAKIGGAPITFVPETDWPLKQRVGNKHRAMSSCIWSTL